MLSNIFKEFNMPCDFIEREELKIHELIPYNEKEFKKYLRWNSLDTLKGPKNNPIKFIVKVK